MKELQFSLASFLLFCGAFPIWVFLIWAVADSKAFGTGPHRFLLAPYVLIGITIAVQRLLRNCPNSWSLSSLIAAVIAVGSLTLAQWMSK